MSFCVYTTHFQSGELLLEQPAAESQVPFFCFSDDTTLESNSWQLRTVVPLLKNDRVRSERYLKLQAYRLLSEYDYSLYIDHSVVLTESPEKIFERYLPASGLGLFQRSSPISLFEEILTVFRSGDDDPIPLFDLLRLYQKDGEDRLLDCSIWTGVLLLRHKDPPVAAILDDWAAYVMRFTRRDNLLANSVFRKAGFSPDICEIDISKSWFHVRNQAWGDGSASRENPNTVPIPLVPAKMRGPILDLVTEASAEQSFGGTLQKSVEKMATQAEELEELRASLEAREAAVQDLRRHCDELGAVVESAEQWQKSWLRRVFFRWHPGPDRKRCGFFDRSGKSLRKRLEAASIALAQGEAILSPPPAPTLEKLPDETSERNQTEVIKKTIRLQHKLDLQAFLNRQADLNIPHSDNPKISILIILFNNAEFTLSCLRALEAETEIPIEVILIDNDSKDETGRLLERIRGAKVVQNQENLGYLKAVNQAATMVRGEYILLLNNDAILRPGSLASSLKTIEPSEDIAAVGGRLVRPDGTLQEAGCIVWNNGECAGYARGQPENSFEAMFRRDVDHCSAAFLLLRRASFESCGGFDETIAPASCEEFDLAMTFHEKGYRVVYEPAAVVDLFENARSEDFSGTRSQLEINQRLFQSKHQAGFETRHPPSARNALLARSRQRPRRRVLFLESHFPHSTNGAGCPRALEMLLAIHRAGFFVTFWALGDRFRDWEAAYRVVPREMELVLDHPTEELHQFLKDREGFYTTLVVSRPQNMEVIQGIKGISPELFHNLKIIYDAEAIYAARKIKMAEVLGRPLSKAVADSLVDAEISLAKDADGIAVTSPKEKGYFLQAGCQNVQILSHCVSRSPGSSEFSQRSGFLFVGRLLENFSPNADSLLWFALKVLPILRQRLGKDIPVNIIGANDELMLKRFGDASFRFLGPIDNIDEWYDSARVFIAPTRFAAGIPLKILEAAAYGVPVVATKFLADLLDWASGEHLLAADDHEGFAEHCIRLHTEKDLWKKIRENALSKMEAEYSPEGFSRDLVSLL